jgi:uncharacterized membrane protein
MKKNFITGVVLLLPVTLTFAIFIFIIDVLTNPFIGFTENIISHYHLFHSSFLAKNHIFFSRCLILVFLGIVIFITGFLAQIFFLKYIFSIGDYLIHRIPFVNRIYKTIQDVIHTFVFQEKINFAKVAFVSFPHKNAGCLALITADKMPESSDASLINKVSLFVPGSPNPTMGFMLLYDKSDITFLDMTVEEAFKFLVSCGGVTPHFRVANDIRDTRN